MPPLYIEHSSQIDTSKVRTLLMKKQKTSHAPSGSSAKDIIDDYFHTTHKTSEQMDVL